MARTRSFELWMISNFAVGAGFAAFVALLIPPYVTEVSPLAIPLLLNPIGIVAFTVFSVQVTAVLAFSILMGMIAVVALLDYVILANAHRLDKVLTPERTMVAERILGVFLAALSVQLVLNGLAEAGVITLSVPHS